VKDPKDKDGGEEIHYSIYAPQCSDVERVRKFLDGGKLDEMFAEKEKEIEKGEKGFNQGYFGPSKSSQLYSLSDSTFTVTDSFYSLHLRPPRCLRHDARLQAPSSHPPTAEEALPERGVAARS
jgi:hypothetical protein